MKLHIGRDRHFIYIHTERSHLKGQEKTPERYLKQ